jgi:hypothetical protein
MPHPDDLIENDWYRVEYVNGGVTRAANARFLRMNVRDKVLIVIFGTKGGRLTLPWKQITDLVHV